MPEARVLIVDDDAQVCRLLRRVLEGGGYVCTTVTTIEEALRLLADQSFEVVLLDMLMGSQSGLELAARLFKQHPDSAVLIVTALDDRESARVALEAGAAGYLIKPFTPNEILINVSSALRRRDLAVENRHHREGLERLVAERTAELTEAEARYRGLFENVPLGLFRSTRDGRILDANPAYLEILRFPSLETARGTNAVEIYVDRSDRERWLELSDRDGVVRDFEMRARRFDGSIIWVRVTVRSVLEPGSELRFYEGSVTDVTELKRAEVALRENEERFRLLAETAQDVVFRYRVHPKPGLDYISPSIESLLGYRPEEFYEDPGLLFRVVHEQDKQTLQTAIATASSEPVELRWVHRGGALRWLEARSSPLLDEAGALVAIQGMARDVTVQKLAREELRRSDQERRRLLSSLVSAQEEERQRIAADIHDDSLQVMTAVGMRMHLLGRRLDDAETVAMVAKLEEIVDLSISRLRNMLFELRPPTLDREGLGPALSLYVEQTATEGGPEYAVVDRLEREPPSEVRVVLYRIAQEALTNARKHARAHCVEALLEDSDGGFRVTIRDDGAGFVPEEVADPQPGHLGLPAIRERAQMAGGWARIESAPGEGTTVQFWVPSEPARVAVS